MVSTLEIPGNWSFNRADVARSFDAHVREQLPWYDLATCAVAHIARHYVPQNGLVYDIGASTGNIGRAIETVLNERNAKLIPIEASRQMARVYDGPCSGNIIVADATEVDFEPFDLAVCFLTLMFVPPGKRMKFLNMLRKKIKPGGAIVIVDKCRAEHGYSATVLWRLTLAGKLAAGADPKDIIAKELSLGGVQRPIDPDALLMDAVEWLRFGEFAGYLIEGAAE